MNERSNIDWSDRTAKELERKTSKTDRFRPRAMTLLSWAVRLSALTFLGVVWSAGFAVAAGGTLTNLVVSGLSPAFDPAISQYTIPKTSKCSVPVVATLANPAHRLYISSVETASGASQNAWVCDGKTKIDVVIYQGWTEMGRYTVTPVASAAPPPPPPPVNGKLTSLVVAGLSPGFDANVKLYTIPRTSNCAVPVTATLADPTLRLYIQSTETASGATRSAWICDGKTAIDIVVFKVWTEVGRYTVTPEAPPPSPEPTPAPTPMPTPPPTTMPPPTPSMPPPSTPPPSTPPPALPDSEPTPEASPAPTYVASLPAASPVDSVTAVTFLEQTTFGPTAADIALVQSKGLDYWLTQQFQLPETTIPDGLDPHQLRAQLFLNMANAPDQLRQRVMFALSQILVVSAAKNVNGDELIPWLRMLSRHAFGNYRTLLREATLSPSMGKYLDLANSGKAMGGSAPNENYPREMMQLFSIGLWELNQDGTLKTDAAGFAIPSYPQATLKDVARALTGWTYPTRPGAAPGASNWEYFAGLMEPRPASHDTGAKTLFGVTLPGGQTVTQDLNGVVDAVFQHPNVPPFIATRLIRFLVTSNPTPAYIKRVADVFADNGYGVRGDLRAVLQAIFTDVEAAVLGPQDGRLKDPVLHIIGMGRALDAQITDPRIFLYLFANLGELVLTPTTVFSFYSPLSGLPKNPSLFGPEFQLYAPAQTILRANFIWQILTGQMGSAFKVDLAPFLALAGNPYTLVEKVNQTLFHGRMSGDLRQILVTMTQGTSDPAQRALGALYLGAISSEFAVHAGGPPLP